jgi:hypothetical protein
MWSFTGDIESILSLQVLKYKRVLTRRDPRTAFVTRRINKMSTTHASQIQQIKDLTPLLTDLEDRADRILVSLYLLWQLDEEFAEVQKGLAQQDYIDLIRSNTERMEKDLEVLRRKNELLADSRLFEWTNNGTDEEEKARRQGSVMRLMKKMEGLQKQMAEAKRGYVG